MPVLLVGRGPVPGWAFLLQPPLLFLSTLPARKHGQHPGVDLETPEKGNKTLPTSQCLLLQVTRPQGEPSEPPVGLPSPSTDTHPQFVLILQNAPEVSTCYSGLCASWA